MPTESVRVRDCTCPGKPHEEEGDVVFLPLTLPMEAGIIAEQAIHEGDQTNDELTRRMLIVFVRHAASGWNFEDENGPVPFDVEALMADWALARPVAIRAGELYLASVTDPFQTTRARPSRTGPTRATTSRRRSRTPSSSSSP